MADIQTDFVMSMAIVIAVAAVIIVLFHRLRQPLILGYLVAGILVSPLVPTQRETVQLLATLGVILVIFSIGLEFNLRKLREIGVVVIVAAMTEIALMIVIGYQLGLALGWSPLESVLLGAILSNSSTMIIVRALKESGGIENETARLIVALTVLEDFAAIIVLAATTGLISTGGVSPDQLITLLVKMAVFVAASLVFGLALVPRLVDYIGRQRSGELLVIAVIGLCFSMAYFSLWMGFSVATGAFVMGIIVSESKHIKEVIRRTEPVKDVFGAMFFISMGMLVDLTLFGRFIWPALIIAGVFIVAKMFATTLSTFVCGFGARKAVGVGFGMFALGEFSLIIASAAAGAPEIADTLFPTVVMLTTITALVLPYSVRYTPKITRRMEMKTPRPAFVVVSYLNIILTTLKRRSRSSVRMSDEIKEDISTILVNIVVLMSVIAIMMTLANRIEDYAYFVGGNQRLLLLLVVTVGCALIIPALYIMYIRSIRLIEVLTSEAMLSTRSAEYVGYSATARGLKWALFGFYVIVGFIITTPFIASIVEEGAVFAVVVGAIIVVATFALWNSVQIMNSKLSEVIAAARKRSSAPLEPSREIAEIVEIISMMEREKP